MIFLYGMWLKVPLPLRQRLATRFNIPKTRPTHVSNNEVVDDGYDLKQIEERINENSMREFTGSESTNVIELWDLTLLKIADRPEKKVEAQIVAPTSEPEAVIAPKSKPDVEQINKVFDAMNPQAVAPKKRGRPSKNTGNAN